MSEEPRDEQDVGIRGSTSSHLSGSAGDVVQARNVHGGIHFHAVSEGPQPSLIPRQLPGNVRGLVNRVAELGQLDTVLESGRVSVVVIAGTAGVGKTALTLHWAHHHYRRFPDGQLYINLRGYDPGDPVAPAAALERFLTALGVAPGAVPAEVEARADLYRSLLAERRMLVVLDNAATVTQVRPLLPGAGDCLVVATSRSRLSGLVARDGAHRVVLPLLPEHEAVTLLQATTMGYRHTDEEAHVIELARLCGRLPLALRIAAERAAARPTMPLETLIQDLRDESSLWDALSSEDDDEADSVRTVFAWSYRALPEPAAHLFRLLGVHPGPEFSTDAAAALADRSVGETRRLLDVLVGTYLIEQSGPDRYQFHDLLRAYAIDQAAQHEDPAHRHAALERIAIWYLHTLHAAAAMVSLAGDVDLVEHGTPPVAPRSVPDPDAAQAWIYLETENLIATAGAADAAGLHRLAWQTLATLRRPYIDHHPIEDWIPLGEQCLTAARRDGDPAGQISALVGLGISHRLARHLDRAVDCHQQAMLIDTTHPVIDLHRRNQFGLALMNTRQFGQAHEVFEQLFDAAHHVNNRFWMVVALGNLADTLYRVGELEDAEARITEAFTYVTSDHPRQDLSDWRCNQAMILRERGRIADAERAILDALDICRGTNLLGEGYAENEHGRILLAANQPGTALEVLAHAVSIHRRTGNRSREAIALDIAGNAYQAMDRPDEAAAFHRQAAAIHQDLHDNWDHALALKHLAEAYDALGEPDRAHHARSEATALIHSYDDPRATALRRYLSHAARDPGAQPPT